MTRTNNPSETALLATRDTPPAPSDQAPQMPPHQDHATDSQDDDTFDDFDLRDLADGPAPPGDLLGGIGIPGLDASARDPLSDLLRGVPMRATLSRDASASTADRAAQPPSGILAELREEFERVARDPSRWDGQNVWQGLQAVGDERALTLAQLQRKAQGYRLPDHMMLPRQGIDELIEGFGPSDGLMPLHPEERVDVLHLFAGDLLRDLPQAIPSLTRTEHHATSLDSPIRAGGARTPPEASS